MSTNSLSCLGENITNAIAKVNFFLVILDFSVLFVLRNKIKCLFTSEAQAIILSGTLKAHSSVFGRDGEIVYDADDNSQYPRLKFLS